MLKLIRAIKFMTKLNKLKQKEGFEVDLSLSLTLPPSLPLSLSRSLSLSPIFRSRFRSYFLSPSLPSLSCLRSSVFCSIFLTSSHSSVPIPCPSSLSYHRS